MNIPHSLKSLSVAIVLAVSSPFISTALAAEEVFEAVTLDGKLYSKVAVREANPVDLLLYLDQAVFKRFKRQDLPEPLKSKYPYDAVKAAEYEKAQLGRRKLEQDRQRQEIFNGLLRQEKDLQKRIDAKIVELGELQTQIKLWRARPNKPPKGEMLNQLLQKKEDLIRHIDDLRRQLDAVHKKQELYR